MHLPLSENCTLVFESINRENSLALGEKKTKPKEHNRQNNSTQNMRTQIKSRIFTFLERAKRAAKAGGKFSSGSHVASAVLYPNHLTKEHTLQSLSHTCLRSLSMKNSPSFDYCCGVSTPGCDRLARELVDFGVGSTFAATALESGFWVYAARGHHGIRFIRLRWVWLGLGRGLTCSLPFASPALSTGSLSAEDDVSSSSGSAFSEGRTSGPDGSLRTRSELIFSGIPSMSRKTVAPSFARTVQGPAVLKFSLFRLLPNMFHSAGDFRMSKNAASPAFNVRLTFRTVLSKYRL